MALERDPKLATAYKLRGYVQSTQARESCRPEDKIALFNAARESFELALDNAAPGDPDRTDYLIGLCNTHVNLGNYQPAEHADHLLKAEAYGQEATKDRSSKYLELAFRALGNAQEDLAWIGGRREAALEEYYPRAVDSFRAATSIRPDLGPPGDWDEPNSNGWPTPCLSRQSRMIPTWPSTIANACRSTRKEIYSRPCAKIPN